MFIVVILALGLFLSAYFSGTETGFYRITRVRLLLDAKSGSWIARSLLWLVARPTIVVATVLIGNNIANYLVSLGLVLASQSLMTDSSQWLQTLLPVLATPLLFVYGELLPKYLYYNAPYALSTRGAPLMVLCSALFFPISCLVIGLEFAWHRLMGSEHTRTKFTLERQELQRVMMEGQEAGILRPVQRELSQNLFTYGTRPIRQFAMPLRAVPSIPMPEDGGQELGEETRAEILSAAKRYRRKYIGLLRPSGKELAACLSVSDLMLTSSRNLNILPVYRAKATESSIHVLTQMQSTGSPFAQVEAANGQVLGIVPRERLISLLVSE